MKPKLNIIRRALTSALLSVASLFVLPVFAETFHRGQAGTANDREVKGRRLCLGTGARAGGTGAHRSEQAGADRLRLSQWHPHRAKQREHRTPRASYAGRRLRYPREGKGSPFDDLQRRGDAVDGTVDMDRDRAARGRSAGLSGFTRLRAPAAGVFQAALHRDEQGRYGDHCGRALRAARNGASGDDFFAGHTARRRCIASDRGVLMGAGEIGPRAGDDPFHRGGQAGLCVSQWHRDRSRALCARRERDARLQRPRWCRCGRQAQVGARGWRTRGERSELHRTRHRCGHSRRLHRGRAQRGAAGNDNGANRQTSQR